MPIRLKSSNSSSDQFYPLNDNVISDGSKAGGKASNAKEVQGRLTSFTKNVLKSTKNLAFDVTDQYIPNAKEVSNSFKDTIAAAKEDAKKEFGGLINFAKNHSNGASFKETLNDLKSKGSKELKDIKERLKTGKFYMSMEDQMTESMGLDDMDFGGDFDLGDMDLGSSSDTYMTVTEPDTLSAEPFGGVKKGRTKTVNVSARQRQMRNKTTTMHAPKKRQSSSSGSAMSQMRLGDELISSTTTNVGANILKKQEEIWARNYSAQEKNFGKLFGYQNQLLKGVNSLVEFNNNVLSNNVAAQMEFQGKMLAAQQDTLTSLKELKDTMMVVASYKREETKPTLGTRMSSGSIGLDGKAYWENIKKNLGDIVASNPTLSMLTMAPMMTDMVSMGNDTGMKMFDPMNMLTKGIASAFLSKNTKNKMMDFNDLLSNFGGLLTGRMNMLARYGATSGSRTIGRIFGARTNTVSVLGNTGLKDPNAVVGWTSKSDRTLNVVIPTLLAKQLAAMSGQDELHYDYKSGGFKTVKSTMKEIEMKRKMAYENHDTVSFKDAMSTEINSSFKITDSDKNALIGSGFSKKDSNGNVSFDSSKLVDIIQKNIIKNNIMLDPELAQYDKSYIDDLTLGIDEKFKNIAVRAFLYAYSKMNDKERAKYNGAMRNVAQNLQNNMNKINEEYLNNGGENVLYESGIGAQISEMKRSLTTDRAFVITDEERNNPRSSRLVLQKRNARLAREMEINKLEETERSITGKGGISASVDGFGMFNGSSAGGGITNVPDGLNKIFRLLLTGIPVYNQGKTLPQGLLKLRGTLKGLDSSVSEANLKRSKYEEDFMRQQMDERANIYKETVKFNREQRLMQMNWLSYINPLSGSSDFANNNIINKGANKVIDSTSTLYGRIFGLGQSDGSGLFGSMSYATIDLQNTENAIKAFKKKRAELSEEIKVISKSEKKLDKAKVSFNKEQIGLLNKLIKSGEKKLEILKSDNDPNKAKSEDSKMSKIVDQLDSLISSASNKYVIRVRDGDEDINFSARMKTMANTINSDAVAGAELFSESMKTKEGRAQLKQSFKEDAVGLKNKAYDKAFEIKGKIDDEVTKDNAVLMTIGGAELKLAADPSLSFEDAYLETAVAIEKTIEDCKKYSDNDVDKKVANIKYDASYVMDKGLPKYLSLKSKISAGTRGAKTALKIIKGAINVIIAIPVLLTCLGVGTVAGATALGVSAGKDGLNAIKAKLKRNNSGTTDSSTPSIKSRSSASETISDDEATILERMMKMVGVKDDGSTDTPIEKVEAIFKKELNAHPNLKKKWNTAKKEVKKTYKKVYNRALMDGGEVYHQGKSAFESFMAGDWRAGFSHIKGTGGAVKNLFKNSFGIIGKEINKYSNAGLDYIDISGNGKSIGTKIGAGVGGLGGLAFGGGLGAAAGAGAGALLGRKIGGKLGRQFNTIRGALLQQGYMDAPTMKPRDLYALVMATKGKLGRQLRAHPEFKELEARAYRPTVLDRVKDAGKKIAENATKTWHGTQMLLHRTIMYRNLVGLLDQTLNGNKGKYELKTNVYGMDKYMLYATINSLSTKTKEQQRVKDAIMNTKEYKRLSETMRSGKSWIVQEIEDKVNTVKKTVNRFRHFKYRFFIDFLKANGHEGIEFEKDPALIYTALDSWGKQKKNQKTYNVIKQSKAYINLQKAVLKRGVSVEDIDLDTMSKNITKKATRNRSKYPTLLMIINSERTKRDPEIDLNEPESIYNAMIAILNRWEKNNSKAAQANAIRRSKEFKRLCKDVGEKTGASRDKPENANFLQRGLSRIGAGFKKLFGPVDVSGAGSTIDDPEQVEEYAGKLRKGRRRRRFGLDTEEDETVDQLDSKYASKRYESDTKRKFKKALTGIVDKLTKVRSSDSKKISKQTSFDEVKQKIKDAFNKTGNATTALLSGILAVNLSNLKQNATNASKKDGGGGGDDKVSMIKGIIEAAKNIGSTLMGIAAVIGGAGLVTGAINGIKNKVKRVKEEGLFSGLFTKETDTKFNADGTKKSGLQRGMDRLSGAEKMAVGANLKKSFVDASVKAASSGAFKGGIKDGLKTVAKEGGKDFLGKVKDLFLKCFGSLANGLKKRFPNAAKAMQKVCPKLTDKLLKAVEKTAENGVKEGGKAAGKGSLKNAAGSIPGWGTLVQAIIITNDAIFAFISGRNHAGRIFGTSLNTTDERMKNTAGLFEAIKTLIVELPSLIPGTAGMIISTALGVAAAFVPDDMLVEMIYKEMASEEEIDEWRKNQAKIKSRAEKYGVDSDKLVELSNKSFSDKMYDFFHSKKAENKRYAKRLGLDEDQYEDFKNEFDRDERDEKSEKESAKATSKYDKKAKDGKFEEKYPTFSEIKSPSEAVRYFTDPEKHKTLETEAQLMFDSEDMPAIKVVFSKINDKQIGNQTKKIDILNNSFRHKLEAMMNDENWPADLPINETKRNPFTQFAYFSKGRSSDKMANDILKMAGFSGGLKFWGGDNSKNTWTLDSNHLQGNAIDFNLSNLSKSELPILGEIAKKNGIEWGGNWEGKSDLPHFEDENPQRFATGGIVRKLGKYGKMGYVKSPINYLKDVGDKMLTRLNPGEMVLNMNQQKALFNKIKRYEYDETIGATARNPVRLSESPMVTNDRDTLVILNKALELQNKIYQEQTRHNKVSEDFFDGLMKILGVLVNNPALIASINNKNNNYKERIDDMSRNLLDGAYQNASGMY